MLEIDSGDGAQAKITAGRGNHPNGVWAYRVEHGGHAVVYATDMPKHYAVIDPKLMPSSPKGWTCCIYDAQYTPEEYAEDRGNGRPEGWLGPQHAFEAAVGLAKVAGAKQLILFHHDPMQTDAAVREKEARAKATFPNTTAAYEGLPSSWRPRP